MPSPIVSYLDEIQTMMYAAGDCRRPLIESASIVEEIVYKQTLWFVHRAQAACEQRGGDQYLDAEDLIYVLRSHPILLTRIIQKLKAKDYSVQTSKSDDGDGLSAAANAEDGEDELDEKVDVAPAMGAIAEDKGRRMKFCKKILDKIDPSGHLSTTIFDDSTLDAGKADRLRRISAHTAAMDADEYVRFSEARQVSFTKSFLNAATFGKSQAGGCASVRKLRDWLFGSDSFFAANGGYKPPPMVVEILNILAYETLATIMDCAFLVKKESSDAGFGSRSLGSARSESAESDSASSTAKGSPLIATSTSQQTALLLSQKLRAKPQNRDVRFGIDRLINDAVQPWELREAVRRLRFAQGNSPHTLFENSDSILRDRVIF